MVAGHCQVRRTVSIAERHLHGMCDKRTNPVPPPSWLTCVGEKEREQVCVRKKSGKGGGNFHPLMISCS